MLLLLGGATRGYRNLDEHEASASVEGACARCSSRLGHALGDPWTECVVEELLAEQHTAKQAGQPYFPMVPHVYQPLAPAADRGYGQTELFKHLLRNCTCSFDDGGSPPLRSLTWEYKPADPCADGGPPPFAHSPGFLPAGNDLLDACPGGCAPMTEAAAMRVCESLAGCAGFTYSTPAVEEERRQRRHVMHFKTSGAGVSRAEGWHSWIRSKTAQLCASNNIALAKLTAPQRLRVDVLREQPPVFLVHDFASEEECAEMMRLTIPHMTPSVVSGGGTSRARQSFSTNMEPDWSDELNTITRIARRKFAFAREVGEYPSLVEGPGQEPVNSVFYKNFDDQYRAHCDGECHGGPYRKGKRIASSLTYCEVAQQGGFTAFTRSGLKVQPKPRQMLFFGYKINGETPRMDNGLTEHTGCPLRRGRKWIATMWYREGMTADKGWQEHGM